MTQKDVMDIYQDIHETIWIGTENSGLYSYKNGLLSNRSLNRGEKNSPVRTFFEDREGSLWIGSKMGLFRIMDGKYSEFNSENRLTFNTVRSVFEDSKGKLWLGSEGKGLFSFDLNTGNLESIKTKSGKQNVLSICEDQKGFIWYGTFGMGLFKVGNGETFNYNTSNGLSNNIIRVVFADRKNNIWVGTNGGGVNVINGDGIKHYSTKNGLSDDFVYSINEDTQGRIWVGTYSGGLNRIENNKIKIFDQNSGLKDNIYWSIYPDKNGSVWFGTNGGGLFRFKNGQFRNYNTQDGLYSDLAFQILEAPIMDKKKGVKKNFLWMNCNGGVFIINKDEIDVYIRGKSKKLKSEVFGTLDRDKGIIGGGPAQPAAWKGKNGKLYFSGKNGLTVFNTRNIYSNKVPPSIIIDKLEVDRVVVDGVVYNKKEKIIIPAGKKRFEFFYTGLSFINSKYIRYKYKIDRVDKNWVNAGTERRAVYMNIPPGLYSFKIMAYNSDGVRSERIESVQFELMAYFWETFWFKIILVFLLLLLIFIYVRLRIRKIKRKMDLETKQKLNLQRINMEKINLEKEMSVKRDFTAMLIHDLKSPLTALIGYSEMIKDSGKSGTKNVDYNKIGNVMSRSLENILKLVNSMLDLSKYEAGKMKLFKKEIFLRTITEDVIEALGPLINNKKITIKRRFNIDDIIYCDPDKISQVVHNLINNSIKFSPENSSIFVKIDEPIGQSDFIEFSVIDEGIGVAENKRDFLFKMYSQLGSSDYNIKGTGLGLNISRIIIEAHKGTIGYRENPTGRGSVFFFTLPKKK